MEHHLVIFDYLASLSASQSNKNFKAKQIQDDLMFSSKQSEIEVLKKIESIMVIIKDLQSMEVISANKQTTMERKQKHLMNNCIDILLKRCKVHDGPVADVKEQNKLAKNTSQNKLKKLLQQEVALQTIMHPNDTKERLQL